MNINEFHKELFYLNRNCTLIYFILLQTLHAQNIIPRIMDLLECHCEYNMLFILDQ